MPMLIGISGDDWDLQKYRTRQEEERALEEEARLAALRLYSGEEAGGTVVIESFLGEGSGSGGGREEEDSAK